MSTTDSWSLCKGLLELWGRPLSAAALDLIGGRLRKRDDPLLRWFAKLLVGIHDELRGRDSLGACRAWVLLEGSQGTLLDIDHGTYPFVTSSSPTAGGASAGSGIGPTRIEKVVGILKAYTTRVGSGPFPTELHDHWGAYLRKHCAEVGVTTGRDRRCGWFDAVIARYATRVNGITDYFLTKLDVLSGLEMVPICVAYQVDGVRHDEMPMTQTAFHHAKPVYEELPGWFEDIGHCRSNAQAYVLRLEKLSGAQVSVIGVGPGRDQNVIRRDRLA